MEAEPVRTTLKVRRVARLRISLKRSAAIEVDRISIGRLKLAYVACADRKLRYTKGRSRIAYIGTTKTGFQRVAQSAANRADDIPGLRGVNKLHVRIVTCTSRQHVKTWHKLERALIIAFRERFGEIPKCNSQGKRFVWTEAEDKLFRKRRLLNVIDDLS